MPRPRLLDLFCGGGGCAVGYSRAGFEVVGVDNRPQPRYPFEFHQGDALEFAAKHGGEFDVIHASPPCQAYSALSHFATKVHPRLIEPTRKLLQDSGKFFVIENVEGAPLHFPLLLCGTMFGLRVIRHRLFECSLLILQPEHQSHPLVKTTRRDRKHFGKLSEIDCFVSVTGGGNCSVAAARTAMGIDWMTKKEINQAIPPAYTEFIGRRLMTALEATQ